MFNFRQFGPDLPRAQPGSEWQISEVPARLIELHEISQALLARRAVGSAARQLAELLEVDGLRALRFEIFIDEIEVGELVLGVVVNILRHVIVDIRQQSGIGLVSAPFRFFIVLTAAELVILLPQIGFEYFERR